MIDDAHEQFSIVVIQLHIVFSPVSQIRDKHRQGLVQVLVNYWLYFQQKNIICLLGFRLFDCLQEKENVYQVWLLD